jgi:uncharacterized protein (DUF305 family)
VELLFDEVFPVAVVPHHSMAIDACKEMLDASANDANELLE